MINTEERRLSGRLPRPKERGLPGVFITEACMKLEIRNISISSLIISSLPIVVFALAVLGGVVTFMVVPNPQIEPMNIGQKLLSIGLFALLYVVIVSALMVFVSFLYNVLTGVLGMKGVSFDIEEINDHE